MVTEAGSQYRSALNRTGETEIGYQTGRDAGEVVIVQGKLGKQALDRNMNLEPQP